MSETDHKVRKFGIFEVDVRAGELRRNGVKVKLQDQPFRILTSLLERPGEVVTRDELRGRLWPADTFVDFDHSLNTAVRRLRDALDDSAENPRFVETVARRGYRFLATVNGAAPDANAHGASELARSKNRGIQMAVAWILSVAGLAATLFVVFRMGAHSVPRSPRITRLTSNSPEVPVFSAAISPDGRFLAYIDPRGIFVRPVASDESHALALPEGWLVRSENWLPDRFLSWFADGNYILVSGLAAGGENSSLWKIPLYGGTPRRLIENAALGSVSPDGQRIAFLRNIESSHSELWMADADGGETRKITIFSGWLSSAPAWSPDGRKLAYVKETYWPEHPKDNRLAIETLDLATEKVESVLADERLRGGIAWTRDSRLLFSLADPATNQEQSSIWSLEIDPRSSKAKGKPELVNDGPDWNVLANVSSDGKRAAFVRNNIMPSVYLADVDLRTGETGSLRRLTADEWPSWPYEWTPDGKAVLYRSYRGGMYRIYRQDVGAAMPELLSGEQESVGVLRLNPDGSEILYTAEQRPPRAGQQGSEIRFSNVRLMGMPIGGGSSHVLVEDKGILNFQCARAPARECVFGVSTKDALAFVEFDAKTGQKRDLLRLAEPDWKSYNWSLSPDGKMLALAKNARVADGASVRLKTLGGGAERTLKLKDCLNVIAIDWAADGKSLWASALMEGEMRAVVNIDLRGQVKPVLQVHRGIPFLGWAIPSRDGKRLAIWQATGGSNAWMLEGF